MEGLGVCVFIILGGFLWEGYCMVRGGHEGTGNRVGLGYRM